MITDGVQIFASAENRELPAQSETDANLPIGEGVTLNGQANGYCGLGRRQRNGEVADRSNNAGGRLVTLNLVAAAGLIPIVADEHALADRSESNPACHATALWDEIEGLEAALSELIDADPTGRDTEEPDAMPVLTGDDNQTFRSVVTPARDHFDAAETDSRGNVQDGQKIVGADTAAADDPFEFLPAAQIGHSRDLWISGTDGDDRLSGGDDNDTIQGLGGDDWLDGGAGADLIDGGAGNDIVIGGAGDDIIHGGDGDDLIFGDAAETVTDSVIGDEPSTSGTSGDVTVGDLVFGSEAVSISTSGAPSGDDIIYGGAGRDVIYGGSGDDRIDGGAGDDVLAGGSGSDIFVFRIGSGLDRIADFHLAHDRLSIVGFGFSGFEDMAGRISYHDTSTEISVHADGIVTLLGIRSGDLTADHFDFA